MTNLHYYFHLLLTNRYSFIIKLTIFVSIYLLFYLKNINNISYCTEDFYIYWPEDSNDNIIDHHVEYYALKDEESRRLLLEHRQNIIKQKNQLDGLILEEHKRHLHYAHNQTWSPPRGRSLRELTLQYEYTPEVRGRRGVPNTVYIPAFLSQEELDNIIEGFLTRNRKPFAGLDYSDLKINKQTIIDNCGKMIREVSTNKHPCDCFSATKRYIDVYYPSYHPDNGFKPHSEVNRHLVETRPGCTIS